MTHQTLPDSQERRVRALALLDEIFREHFPEKLDGRPLTLEDELQVTLGMDSMDTLAMLAAIENTVGKPVELDEDAQTPMSTVADVVDIVVELADDGG